MEKPDEYELTEPLDDEMIKNLEKVLTKRQLRLVQEELKQGRSVKLTKNQPNDLYTGF